MEMAELKATHPTDLARQLEELSEEDALTQLQELSVGLAAQVLAELRPRIAAELFLKLPQNLAAQILEEMAPDAAADLLARLAEEQREALVRLLRSETAQTLRQLIAYPPQTAGGIMSPEFVALAKELTTEAAIEEIRRKATTLETLYYVYVVDAEGHLLGVLSMRDLILSPPQKTLEEIMITQILTVRADTDEEEVARLFDKYDYLALPVVDPNGKLLGLVTADDVIDVIRAEETEDMQRMVGVSGEERVFSPLKLSVKRRLPWLYINLATAFLAAAVVGAFEDLIGLLPALAVFMPVIAGQGGNAGAQSVTVIVRGLALGEIAPGEGKRALLKETLLGILHGVAVGTVVALIAYVWKGNPVLGLICGLAMILNMIAAGVFGAAIPLGLRLFKVDPALSSTIFLTTVTDVAGFFFLLGLAALLLR